jgi:hypothetical protein
MLGVAFSGEQVIAIRRWEKVLRATLYDFQPVIEEIEIRDDPGMQEADGVRRDRVSKAWTKFLGHRGAADDPPSLEDLDSQPRHAEVGSAGQSVVPASDDYDIIRWHT